jgi:hypothetical protein
MASCQGRRDGHTCQDYVYRCTNCGAVGCSHNDRNRCTNQAFAQGGVCQKCGKSGTKEPVK